MAKRLSICAFLFLIFTVACSSPDTGSEGASGTSGEKMKDAGYRRYEIESGIIEYAVSGGQKGAESLYFDKWGMREAKYTRTEISVAGMTRKINQLALMDGEWIYNIDLGARTGTKMKNPLFEMIADKSGTKDFGELGMQMMKDMGAEKVGSEDVAGKPCDIWEVKHLGSKSWIWKSLTLKAEVELAGVNMTSEATKVDEGASVPEDKFAIPPDVTITETPGMDKMMEKMKKGMEKK
ncbi:MAG: hypothetical protein L0229_25070 [Blastocatellia bacterium]|nr:hypothetical protein [Blastocatellia bacterium]